MVVQRRVHLKPGSWQLLRDVSSELCQSGLTVRPEAQEIHDGISSLQQWVCGGLSDRRLHACAAPQRHSEARATLVCMHPAGWATIIHERLGLAVRWCGVQ